MNNSKLSGLDSAWHAVAEELLIYFSEIEKSRTQWESGFDVHARELFGKANEVVSVAPSHTERILTILREPEPSFRAATDTCITVACWLYLNSDESIRRLLRETIAPLGGIVTLLANLS